MSVHTIHAFYQVAALQRVLQNVQLSIAAHRWRNNTQRALVALLNGYK